MDFTNVDACPLCGATQSVIFDRRVFRSYAVQNRLCSTCGFVYQSPRISDKDLEAFYAEEYRLTYQEAAGPTRKDLFVQRARAGALADFLDAALPGPVEPATHLDIGSSSGLLLERLNEVLGLQGTGVEPGDAYRDFACKRGLKVVSSLEDLTVEGSNRFGLVSLVHVLEHLPDPVQYLQMLRQDYLAQDGWLLVEVPNLFAHDSFEVAHLCAFSAHTLTQALLKAGYRLLALRVHGAPRSKLLPLYLTVLAQASPQDHKWNGVQPETLVSLKRRLGMVRRRVAERLSPGLAWLPIPKS